MRDKNRIRPFLQQLQLLWEEHPDLRFGQLYRAIEDKVVIMPYYAEEEHWLKAMLQCAKEEKLVIEENRPRS